MTTAEHQLRKVRLDFVYILTRRRIMEKYIGSAFVLLWIYFTPLIPILTNLLVFYFVANIPQVQDMGLLGYTVFVFSGLLPYQTFQTSMNDCSGLLLNNMDMLKNTLFPLPTLALSSLGVVLFEFSLQLLLLLSLIFLAGGEFVPGRLALLPVALFIHSLMILGLGRLLSIVGYFIKDVQALMNLLFIAAIYVTPTMYPPESAPAWVGRLIEWNPLTHMVYVFRDVLTPQGPLRHESWLFFILFASFSWIIGHLCLLRMKRVVGDMT